MPQLGEFSTGINPVLSGVPLMLDSRFRLGCYFFPLLGAGLAWHDLRSSPCPAHYRRPARLALRLTLAWLLLYGLLSWTGGETGGSLGFQLLYANALLTSGYFLACLILSWRTLQGHKL